MHVKFNRKIPNSLGKSVRKPQGGGYFYLIHTVYHFADSAHRLEIVGFSELHVGLLSRYIIIAEITLRCDKTAMVGPT